MYEREKSDYFLFILTLSSEDEILLGLLVDLVLLTLPKGFGASSILILEGEEGCIIELFYF
jgi:hypothetical protein